MTPENVARLNWFESQRQWHAIEGMEAGPRQRWHQSQARWYSKQMERLPGLFTHIVCEVFKRHRPALIESMVIRSPFLAAITRGRV